MPPQLLPEKRNSDDFPLKKMASEKAYETPEKEATAELLDADNKILLSFLLFWFYSFFLACTCTPGGRTHVGVLAFSLRR